ncbi:MAG: GTPase HflX [Chloroflexi bacterium]|nr:GTPase HflX [Chloroflexota bacterium]
MGLLPAEGAVGHARRALLAGLEWRDGTAWPLDESLDELQRLADTAGLEVVGRVHQRRVKPSGATFFGRGKVEELIEVRRRLGVDLVLVDDDLTPVQQRNLERQVGVPVIDRSGLIIAIFAQRASTREARLQVELARLEYMLPRLSGAWLHLERQMGGMGGRGGPGETQIEIDRRIARDRIATLKGEIAQVRERRGQARARRRAGPPVVALVGYTNAGKSTLMNRLTMAGVTAEDKLFATLDPTARRLPLPGGGAAVIADTVGFIQKLPTQLIAAFKATLEELESADLLLHVIDASHPQSDRQRETVDQVLVELGLSEKPTIEVYNKSDLLPAGARPPTIEAVVVSALTGAGVGALRARIARRLGAAVAEVEVRLPLSAGRLVALFRQDGFLVREEYRPDGIRLHGRLPERLLPAFRRQGTVRVLADSADVLGDRSWVEAVPDAGAIVKPA